VSTPASIAKHPIHPMLVVFPIGLFVFSFVMDLFFLSGNRDTTLNIIALYTMIGGIIGGLSAAVFGFIDFFSLSGRAKRIATFHMSLNLTIVVLFVINAALRIRGVSVLPVPILISLISILLLVISGWLGGELVYVEGVAVEPASRERGT
jgi:uncharacterized membrane protein